MTPPAAAPRPPRSLRLLFFGTPDFAVPSLAALDEGPHPVVGVVSQPDRPRGRGRGTGRGRRTEPTPVKAEALRRDLEILQPQKVGAPDARAWMEARRPDLGVVVAFGQFLPRRVRELPPHGLINAHASLLPRHRGAAPIPYAILEGDPRTGVSVMRVEREMDAGPVCLVRETDIGQDETAGQLSERLAALAAGALVEAVDAIAAGSARFEPQDPAGATLAPSLDREFGRVDWSRPRAEVLRRIRAATPWPGADLELSDGRRLRVLEARDGGPASAAPGAVEAGGDALRVAAGDGWVEVRRLQAPGRRPMIAADFLRGARLPPGAEVARS